MAYDILLARQISNFGEDNMADEKAVTECSDTSVASISADEAALYDRQIRLWGLDAQKRYGV